MTGPDREPASPEANRVLLAWYAATGLFLLLDLVFDLNLRITFLESYPRLRIAYYGFCLLCLALIVWMPGWSLVVGTFESLVSLVALILSFGVRVLTMTLPDVGPPQPALSVQEIVNFLLCGAIAWYAWSRGMRKLVSHNRRRERKQA